MIAKNHVAKAACVGFAVLTNIWTATLLQAHHGNGPESPLAQNFVASTCFNACLWRLASRCLEVMMVEQTCVCNMSFADVTAVDRAFSFLIIGY